MKLTKYFMPLAAIALLASCSDDKIVDQPSDDNILKEGESLMAKFDITMPAIDGTRASFQDFEGAESGTEEATLKNVRIYLFKGVGTVENFTDYTCIGISDLFSPATSAGYTDVEKKATVTVRIEDPTGGPIDMTKNSGNYFGLAVVNASNSFSAPTLTGDNSSFNKWSETAQENSFQYTEGTGTSAKTYFTMTNAPQFGSSSMDTPTASNIITLVKVDESAFAKSPNNPSRSAGTFYVQRGVAKVRIGLSTSGTTAGTDYPTDFTQVPSTVNALHKVSLNYWDLDITNKETYPVQVVSGLKWPTVHEYRYLAPGGKGSATNASITAEIGHLWWGKDPNYSDKEFNQDKINHFIATSSITETDANKVVNKAYKYCLENTMDVDQMSQHQTTRVVFSGNYMLDGVKKNDFIVDSRNDEALDVEGLVLSTVTTGGSYKLTQLFSNTENYTGNWFTDTDYASTPMTILQAVALKMGLDLSVYEGSDADKYTFDFYPKGKTYYVARIRHFDDSETPLPADYKGLTSYADLEQTGKSQLGRYGVLRNNIYDVLVQKVKGYGSPTMPTPDPTDPDPDDTPEEEKYNIQVQINILRWAKRQFDYTLE